MNLTKICNNLVSHIDMNYGTGAMRQILVEEWDAGYPGLFLSEHWITAQGLN